MFIAILASVSLGLTVACVTMRLPSGHRSLYLASIIVGLLLGLMAALAYTWDNEVLHGQVDMPGDAQYYYSGAVSYLGSGETQTYYPLYERYLAAFLDGGGPLVARIGQVMVWLMAYSATVLALASQGISQRGFKLFSLLMAGNGLYYGLMTVFNRDLIILSGLVLVHAMVVKSESLLPRPLAFVVLATGIAAIGVLLDRLQPWLTPLLIVALASEYGVLVALRSDKRRRLIYVGVFVLILTALVTLAALGEGYVGETIRVKTQLVKSLIQDVVIEGSMVELGGATRDLLSPFRLLLGPGLIRPLFPSQYFQVWVPTHAAFYWWGTVVWYLSLFVGLPLLLKRPGAFWGKRGTIFLAILFWGYVVAYVFAYGSGIGLRKRAMLTYFFTTYIASTYWTSERPAPSWLSSWRTRIPRTGVVVVLILLLAVAQLLSV